MGFNDQMTTPLKNLIDNIKASWSVIRVCITIVFVIGMLIITLYIVWVIRDAAGVGVYDR